MPANTTAPVPQPTKKLWQKRIPTFFGLGFLIVALIIGVIFMGQGGGVFAPRATPETTPKNVKLTNVTDNTFSVSFLTDEATPAFIKYGTEENKLNLRSADDRDQLSGTVADYTLHHVTVRNLQPNTTYYYVLGTGGGALFDNNGTVFRVTTARRAGTPSAAKTIYGSVTTESGAPAAGSVVTIQIEGAGDLSALVTNTGGWAVPLSNARTPDGAGYAVIGDTTVLNITVQGPRANQTAQGSVTVADAQPVPTIAFGRGLAAVPAEATPIPTPTPTPEIESTPTPTPTPSPDLAASTASASSATSSLLTEAATGSAQVATGSGVGGPEVTVVDLQNQAKTTVTTTQPTITGKAAANVIVRIEINSEHQIIQQVTADDSGAFELDLSSLQASLEPGEHTVTFTYTDPVTGQDVTTTRTFTVASNTQNQLAQATTPTPTPFGTTNPYPIGGATQSASSTPTPSATLFPTAIASGSGIASHSSLPSTSSGIPVSGAIGTTLALIFGGLFFIIAGSWSFWISSQFAKEETKV